MLPDIGMFCLESLSRHRLGELALILMVQVRVQGGTEYVLAGQPLEGKKDDVDDQKELEGQATRKASFNPASRDRKIATVAV